MKIKVGINGFGRIGRNVLRIVEEMPKDSYEIVAINARAEADTLAHLFKYDSCYGIFKGDVEVKDEETIAINNNDIKILRYGDPSQIPWKELGVDLVIESTGKFVKREDCMKHIEAGAKKVIISAPGKNEDKTIVMGVNENEYDENIHNIISNASCTTNCLAPFAKVLDQEFGIEEGLMTTIHAYTNDQRILDKTHKDLRRARAAGESMIPTTTGAAKAVAKVLPQLDGKLNGFAVRVPTPTVSLVDLVCILKKDATVEEINAAFKKASENEMNGILGYSEEPLVSIDYRGDARSSIIDGLSTMAMGSRMFKVVSWYDNEWGYSSRTVDLVDFIATKMKALESNI
ncbi:MAG: type I glyceraldehyde-3-phosphate dehydrogenase [Terrisporobacter othiniensis]|uniref:type I glyceraldehyde-3-phosphate dehydrogenase n=1 Tax=Terrisporobacter petrolearius TaxID=1460447 RepID=UPI0008ED487B|nr:type I glyceraldehyde-3-phosphate dehydrogenase [Terrisporobacter petrolearius]MDU4862867.1 type I glyceraldehyde-3-phosphate dehydrogenase [Terrisporobacter othiniensis]MDU6995422.1 type I glyceraldehyde-3-phosphate dehydrogenase [Terrisporobacter othiniensis]SFJ27409.1 glyceraldehyde 3-phosphate dehydrogenase [Terrisporobacter glycolicus]